MTTSTTKETEPETVSSNEPPLLQMDGVGKTFGSGHIAVDALKPVSLTVRRSELVAIMGPSGSGKSTLLSLAGALDEPTVGRVLVNGQDLALLSRKAISVLRRRTIGYVFQEFNLMAGLTAVENVQLPLELDGVSIREAKAESMAALERLEIADLANRYPDNLSGGEQQRVAIARAFVGPRTLLLADEPTGSLDSATGDVVMRMLREQCDEGRSGLMVTHDASHAAWADRVVFIKDGVIVSETNGNADSTSP